jgi:hypothetical protein
MMKSALKPHTLQSLATAYSSHELRVNPEYQRGTKWTLGQRQGLIDSLLRGYQIPLFYVHLMQRENAFTGGIETTASLVDGQQRLAAVVSYLKNEFSLPNPQKAAPGTILPVTSTELPPWTGRKFGELSTEDKDRLLGRELLVVEMIADTPNEVRDLFIRLQAGTPLTAQEKRDAWPGDFTNFVIRHAGKPGHPLSNPKRFFNLFPRHRGLSVDDGEHYVDGLADTRKFFAGLAMTIMVRERADVDFVDLKGKTINDFYKDKENLDLSEGDPGALRVIRVLDRIAQLPGFEKLREGKPMPFQMAFHLTLLVDSLDEGNYTTVWSEDVVNAFIAFQKDLASARLHYRNTHESLLHYERFGRLLSGSGSDTADVIRARHYFLLAKVYPEIRVIPRDPNRCYDALEKEVIWNRDRGLCQNPGCDRPDHRVPYREATIHHVIEHTAGGNTTLQNGVLICPECHTNRSEMQHLTSHFQDYLRRIYADPAQEVAREVVISSRSDSDAAQVEPENGSTQNGARATRGKLKIVIDWGALDVDREAQTISDVRASDSIVKLLVELVNAFGKPMEQQLSELKVIRYPLSKSPTTAFLNPATGTPFASIRVPGTDLYFCPQSSNEEKVRRLRTLLSRLTFPDGRDFPPASVEVSIEADPAEAPLL